MVMDLSRRRACAGALALFGSAALAPLAGAAPPVPVHIPPAGGGADALSLPAAINVSGRQRMLTQRLGKAWAMQALGIEPDLAARILRESEALFLSQLGELQKTNPTPEIGAATTALADAWDKYKSDLALKPGKDSAGRVYQSGDQTLQRARDLTALYEKQLGTSQGRLVDIAGRQRMLSQRMARAFYFSELGVADTAKDLSAARQEFAAGLKDLVGAPENTPEIKMNLTLAQQQWLFFQASLDGHTGDTANKDIATTSERILEQLNAVTAQYEKLSRV